MQAIDLAAPDRGKGMSRWSFLRTHSCKSTYDLKAGLPSWSWRSCVRVTCRSCAHQGIGEKLVVGRFGFRLICQCVLAYRSQTFH
jgi:hypothetical protein